MATLAARPDSTDEGRPRDDAGARTASPLPPGWPAPPGASAFRGPAGDFVRAVDPHTEADPVALLVQYLLYFGAIVGRGPFVRAEDTRHGFNEFAVLVGDTAKGRKGTSGKRVHGLFEPFDVTWALKRTVRGLSSGEGLIWHVRDAEDPRTMAPQPSTGKKRAAPPPDPGVDDKRLLVLDGEFASTLRVLERDGNTLSPVLRTSWDGDPLSILTKNWPAISTDAHVSLIGHVTREEVVRYLDRTEMANGFANRILWTAVRRSKILPEGGSLTEEALRPLREELGAKIAWAQGVGELSRGAEMRALWAEVYPRLSEPVPGLVGHILARSEAHVLRLTGLYALLDGSTVMERAHLEAALALWAYCERSARYIFGEALGDPLADELLDQLRQRVEGLSRTEIRDLFSRHGQRSRVDRALQSLRDAGLARKEMRPTAGRPEERWYALVASTASSPTGGGTPDAGPAGSVA